LITFAIKKKVIPEIKIKDYSYTLPDNRIAKYPLPDRDSSKILIFEDGIISEDKFSNLARLLPPDSMMVFNNTKVVPARLLFKKESGAHIEVFCLEPFLPEEYNLSFETTTSCSWLAVVGNVKKWKSGFIYFEDNGIEQAKRHQLKASLVERIDDKCVVQFHWQSGSSFSTVMDTCGKVPIPPYLNRDSEDQDTVRYQTVYAQFKGSVAAPTAGLHFSEHVLTSLAKNGITSENIVLHVGAGTFLPVKADQISSHKMHSEPFSVTLGLLEKLLRQLRESNPVVAVGTTSVRTLESLYWLGVKCMKGESPENINQWEPYEYNSNFSVDDSLLALLKWMKDNNRNHLERKTEIIIVPGYEFKLVDILITNFHQPKSTLLLLIAAFTKDRWKDIYDYALENEFRFLSYGDSSLLFRDNRRV